MTYVYAIMAVMLGVVLWRAARGCNHDVRATIHDYQICLDCGAKRHYEIDGKKGPWRKNG